MGLVQSWLLSISVYGSVVSEGINHQIFTLFLYAALACIRTPHIEMTGITRLYVCVRRQRPFSSFFP